MSLQLILRLMILAVVVVALAVYLTNRRQTHRCPHCQSPRIKEIDRLTEKIELNKRGVPGIGTRVNVSSVITMHCHACGHQWQKKETT